MRLIEDMTLFGPDRMLDWLLVAFTLGQDVTSQKASTSAGHLDEQG